MHTIKLQEATGRLAELIDEVASGEEVVITRDDGATFKIIPVVSITPSPKFGSAKGRVKMTEDFDEPLEDF
jgi:prevent-host-death family protein